MTPRRHRDRARFWTYQSNLPTPTIRDLPTGAFSGTQADFEQLSPGMRREVLRRAIAELRKLDAEH